MDSQNLTKETTKRDPVVKIKSKRVNVPTSVIKSVLYENIATPERKWYWVAPLGILLSLLISIFSADFKDALGVNAQTIKSIVSASAFVAAVWLIQSIIITIGRWKNRPKDKKEIVDKIIGEIRNYDEENKY